MRTLQVCLMRGCEDGLLGVCGGDVACSHCWCGFLCECGLVGGWVGMKVKVKVRAKYAVVHACRLCQNRLFAPYTTVYSVISLP